MKTDRDDAGFTLIELMVVVATILVLAAIAIPKFNNVIKSSADRTTQQGVVTAATVEIGFLTLDGGYIDDQATLLHKEQAVKWENGTSPLSTGNVYVKTVGSGADAVVHVGAKSQSGGCFYVKVPVVGDAMYGASDVCADATSVTYLDAWRD